MAEKLLNISPHVYKTPPHELGRRFCVRDLTNPLKSNKIAVEYANDAEGKEYPSARVKREAGWCKAFDGHGEGRPGVLILKS